MEYSITWDFIFIEIQINIWGMNNIKYHLQLGSMITCTKIMMAATNKRGQRDMKGATSVCFIFGSFFSSNKSAEAEMGVGAEIIGVVKTNTKGF